MQDDTASRFEAFINSLDNTKQALDADQVKASATDDYKASAQRTAHLAIMAVAGMQSALAHVNPRAYPVILALDVIAVRAEFEALMRRKHGDDFVVSLDSLKTLDSLKIAALAFGRGFADPGNIDAPDTASPGNIDADTPENRHERRARKYTRQGDKRLKDSDQSWKARQRRKYHR